MRRRSGGGRQIKEHHIAEAYANDAFVQEMEKPTRSESTKKFNEKKVCVHESNEDSSMKRTEKSTTAS